MAGFSAPRTPSVGGEFFRLEGEPHQAELAELRTEFLKAVDRNVPSVGLKLGQCVSRRVLSRDRSLSQLPPTDFLESTDFLSELEARARESGLFVPWFYKSLIQVLPFFVLNLDGFVAAAIAFGNEEVTSYTKFRLPLGPIAHLLRDVSAMKQESEAEHSNPIEFSGEWNPLLQRRDVATKRLEAEFNTILEYRLDQIEQDYSDNGYSRQPAIGLVGGSRRSHQKLQLHCDWLALYQCGRMSFSEIADRYPAEKESGYPEAIRQINRPNTIQKAAKQLAEQINLPLRT